MTEQQKQWLAAKVENSIDPLVAEDMLKEMIKEFDLQIPIRDKVKLLEDIADYLYDT